MLHISLSKVIKMYMIDYTYSMKGKLEPPGLGSSTASPLQSQVFGTRAAVPGPAQRSAEVRDRRSPAEPRPVVRAEFDTSVSR